MTTMYKYWFVVLLLGYVSWKTNAQVQKGHESRVLILAGGRPCKNTKEANILSIMESSARKIRKEIVRISVNREINLIIDPSISQIKRELKRDTDLPLWLFYLGHGNRPKKELESYICLKDGQYSINNLVRDIPDQVPHASLLIDACKSTYVAIHESPLPISVISASSENIDTGHRETIITEDIIHIFQKSIDFDGDGFLSDQEIFRAMNLTISNTKRTYEKRRTKIPKPKLRRQAKEPIPVLRLVPTDASQKGHKKVASKNTDFVAEDNNKVVSNDPIVTPTSDGGWQIRYVGWIGPSALAKIRKEGLTPLPCVEDVGQCFRKL